MSEPAITEEGKTIAIGVPSTVAAGIETSVYYVVYCNYGGHTENSTDAKDETFIFDSDGRDVSNYAWYSVPGEYTVEIRSLGKCPTIGASKAPRALVSEDLTFKLDHAPRNASLNKLDLNSNHAPGGLSAIDGELLVGPSLLHAKHVSIKYYPTFVTIIDLDLSLSTPGSFSAVKVLDNSTEAPSIITALEQLISDDAPSSLGAVKILGASDAPTGLELDIDLNASDGPTSIVSQELLSSNSAPTALISEDASLWQPSNVSVTSLYLGPEMTNHHPRNVSVTEITLLNWEQPTGLIAGHDLAGLQAPFGLTALGFLEQADTGPTQMDACELDAGYLTNTPGNTASSVLVTGAPLAADAANTQYAPDGGTSDGVATYASGNVTITRHQGGGWSTNKSEWKIHDGAALLLNSSLADPLTIPDPWDASWTNSGGPNILITEVPVNSNCLALLATTGSEPTSLAAEITLNFDSSAAPSSLAAVPFAEMAPTSITANISEGLASSESPTDMHAFVLGNVVVGYDPSLPGTGLVSQSYLEPSEFLFEYDDEKFYDSGWIDMSWDDNSPANGYLVDGPIPAGRYAMEIYSSGLGALVAGATKHYPFNCRSLVDQSKDLFNWGDMFVGEDGSIVHTVAWAHQVVADYDCDGDGYFDVSSSSTITEAHWYRTPESDIDHYISHVASLLAPSVYKVINGAPYYTRNAAEIEELLKDWRDDALSKSTRDYWIFLYHIIHRCRLERRKFGRFEGVTVRTPVFPWEEEYKRHKLNDSRPWRYYHTYDPWMGYSEHAYQNDPTATLTPRDNWMGELITMKQTGGGSPCESGGTMPQFWPGHVPVDGTSYLSMWPFYTPWGSVVAKPNEAHYVVPSGIKESTASNWGDYIGPKYHPRTHENNFSFAFERMVNASYSAYKNDFGIPVMSVGAGCRHPMYRGEYKRF
jgi:hypothetical protein